MLIINKSYSFTFEELMDLGFVTIEEVYSWLDQDLAFVMVYIHTLIPIQFETALITTGTITLTDTIDINFTSTLNEKCPVSMAECKLSRESVLNRLVDKKLYEDV